MMRNKIARFVKYGALASIVTGSVVTLQSNEWNVLSTGVVRFGRAAIAVAFVVADYKLSLRGIDETSELYKQTKSQIHTRCALRLRAMCWKNGGCFIKVGQHIGVLEYLVPQEYVQVMKVLHQDAPRTSLANLRTVLQEDLGKPVEQLFTSFEEVPLASASVAQVHKAVLKDGSVVAVKIQHPMVKAHSAVDMATMEFLVRVVVRLFPDFQFCWLAEETRKNLPKELDFINEAQNCETVGKMFAHLPFFKPGPYVIADTDNSSVDNDDSEIQDPDASEKRNSFPFFADSVPRIYWSLTTERVLTMEFCEGAFITDQQYMADQKLSVKDVLHKLGELYSEMIFVQGYIHCDPHPGNVLVRRDKRGRAQIILLDHGLYQKLSENVRIDYCGLWQSVLAADVNGIRDYSLRLGIGKQYPLFACMITARSWTSVSTGVDRTIVTDQEDSLIRSNAATYFTLITKILNEVPRELLLIFKTNDVIRGIEASLGSRADASSFLTMSRSCVRAACLHRYTTCTTIWCRTRVKVYERWLLMRLSVYECVLRIRSTWLYRYVSSMFSGGRNLGVRPDLETVLRSSS